jgi:ABC-type transport system involved in cytochrome c biogenesis permease subunit
MPGMNVLWLRVAALLYLLGMVDALVAVVRGRSGMFRLALGMFYTGAVLQMVSIVQDGFTTGHFPANDFYQSASLCAFLIAVLFLLLYWRLKLESLSVFVFPLVFLLTLLGSLRGPGAGFPSEGVRSAWLLVHVVLVLVGYAALLFTGVASVLYLVRERQLKRKTSRGPFDRLPPLGVLDELTWKTMAVGFIFITLAVIAGSTWAFVEWKRRWLSDPRIVISLVTWLLYLVMVFLRVTAGWRGRKAAVMVITLGGFSVLTWAAHTGLRHWLAR